MFSAERSHPAAVPAVIAFAAAALALCVLQLAAGPFAPLDGLVEALWITGWVLVVWAIVVAVGAGVLLWQQGGLRARAARMSAGLVVATVGLLALVVLLFPPVGAGGAMG